MKNKITLFTNWLAYILICLIMYFWENVVILDFQEPMRAFNTNEVIALFTGLIVITIVFFFIEKKYNNYKFDIPLTIILSLMFLCSLISILLAPETREFLVYGKGIFIGYIKEETWYEGVFKLTTDDRLFSILFAFLNYLSIYFLLAVFPRKIRFIKIIDIIFYVSAAFTLVMLTYSYITEWSKYVEFVTTFFDKGMPYGNMVQSFLRHRNNFGFMLYYMIFMCYFVHHNHPKWWWLYLISPLLLLAMIPSLSKTNVGAGFFLVVAYPIGRFFLTYKHHKKRNILALIITLSSSLAVLGILGIIFFINDHLREVTINSLKWVFVSEEGMHATTLQTRTWLWANTFDILNHSSWIFGAGFGIFEKFLITYNVADLSLHNKEVTHLAHNYFIQALGYGGVIYLVFIIFVMVLYFRCLFKLIKKHPTFVFLQFLLFASMIPHMMLESEGPLGRGIPSIDSFMVYAIMYAPVFSLYYHEKHIEDNEEFLKLANIRIKTRLKYFDKPYSVSEAIYLVYTPILAVLIGPVWMAFKNDVLVPVIIGLVLFFFGPYIIHLLIHVWKEKNRKYLNPLKYMLKIQLPFLVGLIVMFTYFRIFLTITGVTYSMSYFVGGTGLFLYALFFVAIPSFNERASLFTTFENNYTNLAMRLYRPYVKEFVDNTKKGVVYE